ncbi:hypothetical protein E2C01_098018 [Portunus trituberculatus]|uniref:Uncharacterized protein n=1 Tax=Portunus trituberculatus TaxID=210409 RepID=A0A5B7KCX0_PORTR|nr:hypothetical protein [Portunus trituberculatus]
MLGTPRLPTPVLRTRSSPRYRSLACLLPFILARPSVRSACSARSARPSVTPLPNMTQEGIHSPQTQTYAPSDPVIPPCSMSRHASPRHATLLSSSLHTTRPLPRQPTSRPPHSRLSSSRACRLNCASIISRRILPTQLSRCGTLPSYTQALLATVILSSSSSYSSVIHTYTHAHTHSCRSLSSVKLD